MKPYSLDDHWELLSVEYHATTRTMPLLDRLWYLAQLAWLRWRIKRASRSMPAIGSEPFNLSQKELESEWSTNR